MSSYAVKSLIAVDMFACSLIWNDSGITISSMTGLALKKPTPPLWARWLGWVLNHIEEGHTTKAIQSDIARAKAALVILGSTNA